MRTMRRQHNRLVCNLTLIPTTISIFHFLKILKNFPIEVKRNSESESLFEESLEPSVAHSNKRLASDSRTIAQVYKYCHYSVPN
jgi:hypothetical protein